MKLKKFTYFYPEKPVLILIESEAFKKFSDDPDYIAEPKFNEQRCELHLINGVAHFWDRHGKELDYNKNASYAEGKKVITQIFVDKFGDMGYFIFDTGLRHNKVSGINNKLVIYDIHVYKDEVLNQLTFEERRNILEGYFKKNNDVDDTVHLIHQRPDNFKKWFKYYTDGSNEFEGLVMKNKKGKLKLGKVSASDSTWMFKVRIQTGRHRY
jgi:ATP-dependent DNA ligase